MKKTTILNAQLSHAIATLGHTDMVTICDAGLPIPEFVGRIDLALTQGIPRFLDTLYATTSEMFVERAILAEEIKQKNPVLLNNQLEQTVYELNVDFDNTTFEQLTDVQHDCYMMVYKNKINNASVVMDYLLFEHFTMPELHEWTKLFNYHYG